MNNNYNSLAEFTAAQRALQGPPAPPAPPAPGSLTPDLVAIIEAHAAGAPARHVAQLETRLAEVRNRLEKRNYRLISEQTDLEKEATKLETELSQLNTAGNPGKQE